MSDPVKCSEAAVGAELAEKYLAPAVLELESVEGEPSAHVLVVPKGRDIISIKRFLDEVRTEPERRSGVAALEELDSFIAHANRFKDKDSALFAQRDPPSMTSVLDYHRAGDGMPRFGTHRGRYDFPLSDEWLAWIAQNSKPMMQGEFAAFIEDRIIDIADPQAAGPQARELAAAAELVYASPSRLLSLSRGLTIRQGVRVTNITSLQSGEVVAHFETQNTDETGAPLTLPSAFLIGIPVFKRGRPYLVAARLRYRQNAGSISWSYELYKHEAIFDDAFNEACEHAQEKTELPLFMGAPEQDDEEGA